MHRQPKVNQDSYTFNPKIIEELGMNFFGVFDGHGTNGHLVSSTVKKKLPVHISR